MDTKKLRITDCGIESQKNVLSTTSILYLKYLACWAFEKGENFFNSSKKKAKSQFQNFRETQWEKVVENHCQGVP